MGVIYKLKPEIIEFIIARKKEDPAISCRKFVTLITEKFQTDVSKSSINAVIKNEGLSMPVGRRQKKRRRLSVAHALTPIIEQTKEPVPIIEKPVEAPIVVEKPKEEPVAQEPIIMQAPVEQRIEQPLVEEKPVVEAPVEKEHLPEKIIQEEPVEEKPIEEAAAEKPIAEKPKEEPIIEKAPEEPKKEPEKEQPAVEPIKAEEPIVEKAPEKIEPKIPESAKEETKIPVSSEPVEVQVPKEELVHAAVVPEAEGPQEFEELGAIMLRAADFLAGGSLYINKLIQAKFQAKIEGIPTKTDALVYPFAPESGFWKPFKQHFTAEEIKTYSEKLGNIASLPVEIKQIILDSSEEARCLKVNLLDNSAFYLDSQFYTIWSTPNIPYDFSNTLYSINARIESIFKKNSPFILFMAPGYEVPTVDFFNFILSTEMRYDKAAAQLVICGNRFEELQKITIAEQKKRSFIFGLWPWQFKNYRRVRVSSDYKLLRFNQLSRDFYIAEAEVELIQPTLNETVKLRGCALKKGPADKISVIILSNTPAADMKLEDLASLYLNNWPNLDETFQDFSRKVELFTYAAEARRLIPAKKPEDGSNIAYLWPFYFDMLEAYVRWHFFPAGYEEKDFSFMKEEVYSLKGKLSRQEDYSLVTLNPPAGYVLLKDLEYACRRINERVILLPDSSRIWLSIA